MNIELQNAETIQTEEEFQYAFVVNAELAYVGGGSALVDY